MVIRYNEFFNKSKKHSMNDLLNLAREIKDFTYNNDVLPTDYFKSIKETEKGYIVDFSYNGDKTYEIDTKKVKDKGIDISIDEAYYNLDLLFNMIQTYLHSFNIHQIDEATDNDGLKKDLMELIQKSTKNDTQEFIKKWVYENYIPEREKTVTLEGFIQDEDKFDFYLKHRDDIDNLLKKIGFFGNKIYQNSLYGWLIEGTEEAVYYIMSEMAGKEYFDKVKNNDIKENMKINEGVIAWFRNFNQESDNFMDLLDAVLVGNKDGFTKAVDEFVLQMSNGEQPSYHLFIPVINNKVFEEYYKIGKSRGILAYSFPEFKKILMNRNAEIIFPKMLFRGVISDMKDGGGELRQYTSGKSRFYLDNLSVERGKEKLGVMLKNKGIVKDEE